MNPFAAGALVDGGLVHSWRLCLREEELPTSVQFQICVVNDITPCRRETSTC